MAIGEIITAADLAAIQAQSSKSPSQVGYVAPTVYRYANAASKNWPYWKSLEDIARNLPYFNGKAASLSVAPAGAVSFNNSATAQTLGINCDFYFYIPITGWVNVPYAVLKSAYSNPLIIPFRFFKPDGSGPFYSVLLNNRLGISATKVSELQPAKLRELDEFHRQIQLLKAKYNTLAIFLNQLAKKQLNPVEQQTFNEGLLLFNNLKDEIKSIQGIQITFSPTGTISGIGVIPVIVYIVAVVLLASAVGWTIDRITTERQKTARINASYDMQKWISEQQRKIAAAMQAGTISQTAGSQLINSLNTAATAAQTNAQTASAESKGILDGAKDLLLIAFAGLILVKIVK